MIYDFKDIKAYKLSYKLTLEVYQITKAFPKEEMFGLTSQLKRVAYSPPLPLT